MTGETLANQTDGEIRFRLNLVKMAIKMLKTDPTMKDDPRQPSALKEYKRQRDELQGELKKRGLLPENVGIQLKTAKLSAKSTLRN